MYPIQPCLSSQTLAVRACAIKAKPVAYRRTEAPQGSGPAPRFLLHPMHRRYQLLRLLADGRFHSGETLGTALGIGRSAVWKLVSSLAGLGLEVFRVPGKGYRLAYPIDFLDRDRIFDAIDAVPHRLIGGVDIHASV